jgi:hypothetical protein
MVLELVIRTNLKCPERHTLSAICTILYAKLRTSTILNGAVERLLKAACQALRDQTAGNSARRRPVGRIRFRRELHGVSEPVIANVER